MNLSSKRILAFIIDVLILFTLITILTSVFVESDATKELSEKSAQLFTTYIENRDPAVLDQISDISYQASKLMITKNYVSIALYIIYFAILPKFTGGQTIGKKVVKIKLKPTNDEELSFVRLIIRAMLLYGVAINVIITAVLALSTKKTYLSVSGGLTYLQLAIFVICFIGLFSKNGQGLHDRLAKTEVVSEETVETEDEWKVNSSEKKEEVKKAKTRKVKK